MENAAQEVLQRLVGLPLWDAGRAANLVWFAFGDERREVPAYKGGTKIVSDYSLHVQCAWHLREGNFLVVASGDMAYPAGDDPYADLENFKDWDQPGANQMDQRLSSFFDRHKDTALVVRSVRAEPTGFFRLQLGHKVALEVFPDNSIGGEHWRLFKPYNEERHFVFTKQGLEGP